MYEIIKNVILRGEYELVDMLDKIDRLWVESKLGFEERNELIELARSDPNPDNSLPEIPKQIEELWDTMKKFENQLKTLSRQVADIANGEEPLPEPEPDPEYPEYVSPTGAHNAYNTGDKMTFQGKKYICKIDNCVWDPLTYPDAWEEVTEGEATT